MPEDAQELLDALGYDDWTVVDESTLECPHGYPIEWDGQCPEGCVSPLRAIGVI